MKAKVAEVFKNKETIKEVISILKKDFLIREKDEEIFLADFVRVAAVYKKTEIFTKADQMQGLINLARDITLLTKNEGDTLFQQGDVGTSFYVILTGAVQGFAKSEETDELG